MNFEEQVVALDSGAHDARVRNPETLEYVPGTLRRRRRRDRQHRWSAQSRNSLLELQIGRQEVVTPMTDAVCLVHDEQGHTASLEGLEMLGVGQPLGRHEHHVSRALANRVLVLALLLDRDSGIQARRLNSDFPAPVASTPSAS